jgi:hypothetical protein
VAHERRELAERHETMGMIVNVALLVFISWTLLLGIINLNLFHMVG